MTIAPFPLPGAIDGAPVSAGEIEAAIVASLEQACAAATACAPRPTHERVTLAEAHGRVLGEDVIAAEQFPRFDASAMDGWAVSLAGAPASDRFKVIGESRAGFAHETALNPGEAVAISTGARIPAGADAIVPVENGAADNGVLVCEQRVQPGAFIRAGGRHAAAGSVVLRAGVRLGAGQVAVLAALGVAAPIVVRRPRVTIVTGGDELIDAGNELGADSVFDSNTPMLKALATALGAEVQTTRYASDDRSAVRSFLAAAIADSQVVITSGGVSVGRHDHIAASLRELGAQHLVTRTVARPGLRFRLAVVRRPDGARVPVVSLPGNPLSSWACFQFYARRVLRATLGQLPPERITAALADPVVRHASYTRLVLGELRAESDRAVFIPVEYDSDATIALARANAHAIIAPGDGSAERTTIVDCELTDG